MMLDGLRKRRTAADAGLADAVEKPDIDGGDHREVPDSKVSSSQ